MPLGCRLRYRNRRADTLPPDEPLSLVKTFAPKKWGYEVRLWPLEGAHPATLRHSKVEIPPAPESHRRKFPPGWKSSALPRYLRLWLLASVAPGDRKTIMMFRGRRRYSWVSPPLWREKT